MGWISFYLLSYKLNTNLSVIITYTKYISMTKAKYVQRFFEDSKIYISFDMVILLIWMTYECNW